MPYFLVLVISLLTSCASETPLQVIENPAIAGISLVVLGNVQDGGSPHIGCAKDCCKDLFEQPDPTRQVVSLGLIDTDNQKKYLFEATPDLPRQTKKLMQLAAFDNSTEMPDGIFLTHAHIGHYAGLQFLGREARGAKNVPVYAMPRLREFLTTNGPWDQLVKLNNIGIQPLTGDSTITLSSAISVTPFGVPHRDEYSETVGYHIAGPNKSALFIPDIDKWEKWTTPIEEYIKRVDYAFLDATFFDAKELNNRDMSEIPHPFIVESMKRFAQLPEVEKNKIYFIHLNHSNPALDAGSSASKIIEEAGFRVARYLDRFEL